MSMPTPERIRSLFAALQGTPVLVLGDLILDEYVTGDADRLSPEAPVPVLTVEQEFDRLGGAANVARNLASLGARPVLVGVVGEDAAGRRLAAALDEAGIAADGIVVEAGRRTGVKTRVLCRGQQLVRIDRETVAPVADRSAERLAEALRAFAGAAIVWSDYGKGVFSAPSCARYLAAQSAAIWSIVDPVPAHMAAYGTLRAAAPNEKEALLALGDRPAGYPEDADALPRALLERYPFDEAYVTLGARGLAWRTRDGQREHVPTEARQVFDVSGAGDTVIAVLALLRGAGVPTAEAVRVANLAAGVVVGKLGTAAVTADEIAAAVQAAS
jgi:D-beta-D-heptose 7-phosphate kinase/D-beta-D-heptose 1-phosphate adenosyltransferase